MVAEIIVKGLPNVSPQVKELLAKPYDSDSVRNLADVLAKDLVNPDNSKAAGRLMIWDASRACTDDIVEYCIDLKDRLTTKFVDFATRNSVAINEALAACWERNYIPYDALGAGSLAHYALRPSFDEDSAETPLQFHMRQAIALHHDSGIDRVLQCYDELADDLYTHSSPINFNCGTRKAQMIACFTKMIGDDLHKILYEGCGDCGMISKGNGGLGISFQLLRHSAIGTSGISSGVVPFGRIMDRVVACVNQGGQRDGAATFFLRISHIDIIPFVQARDKTIDHSQQFFSAGTCIWMSKLFFKRVAEGGKWTSFCPKKATSLNHIYGYEYEEEYVRMEKAAADSEKRRDAAIEAVKKAKNILLSDPKNRTLRDEYRKLCIEMRAAKKDYIEHKVMDAAALYDIITSTQVKSGNPYIMHGDNINYKSNMKRCRIEKDGVVVEPGASIDLGNLCLEICLPSTVTRTYSCNVMSSNLRRHTTRKLDWEKSSHTDEEIREAYDFQRLGKAMRSQVENATRVAEENMYPIDEHDAEGNVIKRGDISTTNLEDIPLGIGASGQFEAVAQLDLLFDSPTSIQLNKMIYPCKYFNGLIASLELAIKKGAYSSFRTGHYKKYTGKIEVGVETVAHADGTFEQVSFKRPVYEIREGSPLVNGQLCFDLWEEHSQLLLDMGDLDTRIYNREDDKPVEPSSWGQQPYRIKCTSHTGEEVDITVEPTWDSLRQMVMKYGVRNSQIMALMPTASSAQRFRNTESTEIPQAMIYSRKVTHGNYTVVVEEMRKDLMEFGFWNQGVVDFIISMNGSIHYLKDYILDHVEEFSKEHFEETIDGGEVKFDAKVEKRMDYIIKKYRTAYEYSQKFRIYMARLRDIVVDQAESLNIYIEDPTKEQLSALHSYTDKMGLKTGMYYLRQSPAKAIGTFNLMPSTLAYRKRLSDRYPNDLRLKKLCGSDDAREITVSEADLKKLSASIEQLADNPELSPKVLESLSMIRNISEGLTGSGSSSNSDEEEEPSKGICTIDPVSGKRSCCD